MAFLSFISDTKWTLFYSFLCFMNLLLHSHTSPLIDQLQCHIAHYSPKRYWYSWNLQKVKDLWLMDSTVARGPQDHLFSKINIIVITDVSIIQGTTRGRPRMTSMREGPSTYSARCDVTLCRVEKHFSFLCLLFYWGNAKLS